MLARSQPLSLLGFGVACLMASGCSEAPIKMAMGPPARSLAETVAEHSKAISEATEQAAEPSSETQRDAPVAEVSEPVYQPPYPERLELFAPPKQSSRVTKQSSGGSAESVVLLGFANLGTPSAVLSIDNVVRPISEGEQMNGVRVISISPPQAVLQRGRSRWTTSIE